MLLNNTDESTFFRQNMKNRSIIHLAFYIPIFRKYLQGDWKLLPHTGSNHEAIGFIATVIEPVQGFNTIKPVWNIKKADQDLFGKTLKALEPTLFNNLNQAKRV